MDTLLLQQWGTEHNIVNRTKEGFWGCFKNWKNEDPDDYDDLFLGKIEEEFINIEPTTLSLVHDFHYIGLVYCKVNIYFMEQSIGNYEMCFDLKGEIFDDFLNFDDKYLIHMLMEERRAIIKVIENCLIEGIQKELISKITGVDLEFIEILNKKFHE